MSSPSNDWVILKMFRSDATTATTSTYEDTIISETKSDKLDPISETEEEVKPEEEVKSVEEIKEEEERLVEVEYNDIDYDSASTVSTLDEVFDKIDPNEIDKELDEIVNNVKEYVIDVLDNLLKDLDEFQSKLNNWKIKNYHNYFKLFNPAIKEYYENRYAVDIAPLPDSDARDRIIEYYLRFGFDI